MTTSSNHSSENDTLSARSETLLHDFVFRELKHYRSVNEIAWEVSQRTNWEWDQAQQFVERIQSEHERSVATWQLRLIIPTGVVFIAAGGYVVFLSSALLVGLLSPFFSISAKRDPIGYFLNLYASWPNLFHLLEPFIGMGLGAAIIVGGAYGVWQAVRSARSDHHR